MSEKDLHRQLREWAYATYGEIKPALRLGEESKGILKIMKCTMLAQYGEAGAPDWAVFVKTPKGTPGYTFFLELKNPDGKGLLTDKQMHYHNQLRALGFHVFIVDQFEWGQKMITAEVQRAQGKVKSKVRAPQQITL
jgi:hypothetical protein